MLTLKNAMRYLFPRKTPSAGTNQRWLHPVRPMSSIPQSLKTRLIAASIRRTGGESWYQLVMQSVRDEGEVELPSEEGEDAKQRKGRENVLA